MPDVQVRTRLWSTECAIADAQSGEPVSKEEPGYEFSSGRFRRSPADPYASFPTPAGEGGGLPSGYSRDPDDPPGR